MGFHIIPPNLQPGASSSFNATTARAPQQPSATTSLANAPCGLSNGYYATSATGIASSTPTRPQRWQPGAA